MVPEPHSTTQPESDPLSRIFGALAHPVRRAILAELAKGDASVAELAQPFAITQRAVSKHISVLENAGLIVRGKDAQRRPSHLDAATMHDAHKWLETYRALWERRFNQIGSILETMQKGELPRGKRRRSGQ
jgi:DNA-binding transcriptional ArsR family regulator